MQNPNVLINSDYGPIIINMHDMHIGKHISQVGYWAKDDINLISQIIKHLLTQKQTVTFYDVGANIGTHSLALGKIFGDKILIHAFEAQRQIYNMLCGTIALNGLTNIYCHNFAVSDGRSDSITFQLPNYFETNNFGGLELIPPMRSDNQTMTWKNIDKINAIALDKFNEPVDFIKMDIEGMEDKALYGAKIILEKYAPVCFIEICKTNADYIISTLNNYGYIGFQKAGDLIAIPASYNLQVNGLTRIF